MKPINKLYVVCAGPWEKGSVLMSRPFISIADARAAIAEKHPDTVAGKDYDILEIDLPPSVLSIPPDMLRVVTNEEDE